MESAWRVVRTQPRREELARQHCERQHCECYLPLHRDVLSRRVLPLFTSYMFVRPPTVSTYFLSSTTGVLQVLRETAPDWVVDRIRDMEVDGIVVLAERPRFRHGDPVRVTRGPFSGFAGIYQGMGPRECVLVLLTVLGGARAVPHPGNWVEAA